MTARREPIIKDGTSLQASGPRRILRAIPSYFPYVTGPANQARAISRGLAPLGYESLVVTTDLGARDAPRRQRLDDVEVLRLPIRAGFMQYHVVPGAWNAFLHRPADLIHVHSYRNYLADVAASAAHRRGLPLILQLHGSLVGYQHIVQGWRQMFYRAFDLLTRPLPTLRAARVIVSTSVERDEVTRYGIPRERVCVIPMGVTPEEYFFPDVQRDPRRITFVGRLAADRNVEQLLRALALIADLGWSCTIAGGEERRSYAHATGYVAVLKDLAAQLGIAGQVTFTGPLYGEVLRRAYAASGIFVYPSRYENFGQTILEAAAAGCVLVTTRVGVANDLVRTGESGFLVDQDDHQETAARLRWLLTHPDEEACMGVVASAMVRQHYAWGPILRCYTTLYDDVVAEPITVHGDDRRHTACTITRKAR